MCMPFFAHDQSLYLHIPTCGQLVGSCTDEVIAIFFIPLLPLSQ